MEGRIIQTNESDSQQLSGASLGDLPLELLPIIIKLAESAQEASQPAKPAPSPISSVVGISSCYYKLFQSPRLPQQFLLFITRNKLDDAKKMLIINSPSEKRLLLNPASPLERLDLLVELLSYSGTVTNYSGLTLPKATALQLAYGSQNVKMCEMLLSFFALLPGGYEAAAKQLNEKFPNIDIKDTSKDFADVCYGLFLYAERGWDKDKIFAEFQAASHHDSEQYHFHFNLHQIVRLLDIYRDYYMDANYGIAWREGVGYLERQIPACHVPFIFKNVGPFSQLSHQESLTLPDGTVFYPLDTNPDYRLGTHYAVTASGKKTVGGEIKDMCDEFELKDKLGDYIRDTEQALYQFRIKLNSLAEEAALKRNLRPDSSPQLS